MYKAGAGTMAAQWVQCNKCQCRVADGHRVGCPRVLGATYQVAYQSPVERAGQSMRCTACTEYEKAGRLARIAAKAAIQPAAAQAAAAAHAGVVVAANVAAGAPGNRARRLGLHNLDELGRQRVMRLYAYYKFGTNKMTALDWSAAYSASHFTRGELWRMFKTLSRLPAVRAARLAYRVAVGIVDDAESSLDGDGEQEELEEQEPAEPGSPEPVSDEDEEEEAADD